MMYDTFEQASDAYAEDLTAHPLLMDADETFPLAGGFTGKISMNSDTGAYCGYVTSPDGVIIPHSEEHEYIIHGGITYGGDRVIGFDCLHRDDFTPEMPFLCEAGIYRVWRFEDVKREIQSLHAQIVDALLPPQEH